MLVSNVPASILSQTPCFKHISNLLTEKGHIIKLFATALLDINLFYVSEKCVIYMYDDYICYLKSTDKLEYNC